MRRAGAIAARAVRVVALVAVGPEAQEPRREPVQLAGLEVERRVAVEQRAHAVQRQPGLGQRPGLGRAQPAAVCERGARPDPVALDDRHVELAVGAGSRRSRARRLPPPTTTTRPLTSPAARDPGRDLELDQDAGHGEPANDRGARRPGRREVLAPDPVPGREVAGVGEEALDAQHLLRGRARRLQHRLDVARTSGACSSNPPCDAPASVAGSTGARPDSSSRSPKLTASEITGSSAPIVEPAPTVM